jgi:hypothetical protein
MAQHRQAPRMYSAPVENVAPAGAHDSRTPPAMMASMPRTTCRSAFSLNTHQAMTAVSTPSTFSSSEAAAPLDWVSPRINSTGPSMPPKTIAPSNHGISLGGIPRGVVARVAARSRAHLRASRMLNPSPLPRYSNPANSSAGTSPTSNLASGVLAPNSSAAARAGEALRKDIDHSGPQRAAVASAAARRRYELAAFRRNRRVPVWMARRTVA